MRFYGLKNCDTCKKAQKTLTEAGKEFEVIDVRADGVPPTVLAEWVEKVGAEALVNRRSTTWRGLSDEEQSAAVGDGTAALLAEHPTLMKRPVIVTGGAVHVGWSKDVQAAVL